MELIFTISMSVSCSWFILLHIMDCTALGASAHLFEVVHLITFFTLLALCQASSWFVDPTTLFASYSCRHFNRCGQFCFSLFTFIFLLYCIKGLYLMQTVDDCCLGSLSINFFCPDSHMLTRYHCILITSGELS